MSIIVTKTMSWIFHTWLKYGQASQGYIDLDRREQHPGEEDQQDDAFRESTESLFGSRGHEQ